MAGRLKVRDRPRGLTPSVRIAMAVCAFIAGASFCFAGKEWHTSRSLYYINQLPVSWWVYGLLLLVGGCCMLLTKVKPIGFLIGAIVYTFFALMVWLAVVGGLHLDIFPLEKLHFPTNSVGNFFAASNLTTLSVLYWSALKGAVYKQVDPEKEILAAKSK
jgi:hypothetical protein